MILIADSGSTKTDWRLVDDMKKVHQFATQGFNPYFQSVDQISEIIESELLPQIKSQISFNPIGGTEFNPQIFFYGAGCGTNVNKGIIRKALLERFKSSIVEVNTDLLGAARALCGNKPGIAAILGTGSNSCFFDGKKIVESRASLGYILGDEGSGAHIGKTFIQAYLNKEMPEKLAASFFEQFNLDKEKIIDAVYKKPMPNRFLASFNKFICQNLKEQFIVDLVEGCFNQFFDKHICKYSFLMKQYTQNKLSDTYNLSCVGSIAFYYSNILRSVAFENGVILDKIIETPIAELTNYHFFEI